MNFDIIKSDSESSIKLTVDKILNHNEKLAERGLILSEKQAVEIARARSYSLVSNGRIDFDCSVTEMLINSFSDSSYLDQNSFANAICQLTDIFYFFKNETFDKIEDNMLVNIIKDTFENECGGDIDFVFDVLMEKLTHSNKKNTPVSNGDKESNSVKY